MTSLAPRWLILLLLVLCATASAQTRKFSDNFDAYSEGDLPTDGNWSQDGTRPIMQVVSSAADAGEGPRSGSRMVRGNWNGEPDKNFSTAQISLAALYTSEGFIRVWFRFDSNLSHPTNGSSVHMLRFFPDPPLSFFLSSPNGTGWQLEGTINSDPFPSAGIADMEDGQWHQLEIYWNTSTGVLKAWLDDTLEVNETGATFVGDPDDFFLVSNMGGNDNDATNYVYMDDFEFFSDAEDGDAVTGSMSDGTIAAAAGGGGTTIRLPIRISEAAMLEP